MSAPTLQAQIDIDAPADRVWSLISDLGNMPKWSPQCMVMKPLGPVRPGTRTINLYRRKLKFWPTTCTILDVSPGERLAFKVDVNNTVWAYDLEPTPNGTRVIETRHAENGVRPLSNLAAHIAMGGVASWEQELLDGMRTSLARIKAAAEKT